MTKIKYYKYDNSDEEKKLNEMRHLYTEIKRNTYFKKNEKYPMLEEINRLNFKIEEAKKAKEILSEYKKLKLNDELFDVHFYFEPDIGNNGGVRTIVTKEQLEELINIGNQLTNVYFVKIYDINKSFKEGKNVVPDFIPSNIKEQINNPKFNSWHSQLLKD
jgi:hypothetical protein